MQAIVMTKEEVREIVREEVEAMKRERQQEIEEMEAKGKTLHIMP